MKTRLVLTGASSVLLLLVAVIFLYLLSAIGAMNASLDKYLEEREGVYGPRKDIVFDGRPNARWLWKVARITVARIGLSTDGSVMVGTVRLAGSDSLGVSELSYGRKASGRPMGWHEMRVVFVEEGRDARELINK